MSHRKWRWGSAILRTRVWHQAHKIQHGQLDVVWLFWSLRALPEGPKCSSPRSDPEALKKLLKNWKSLICSSLSSPVKLGAFHVRDSSPSLDVPEPCVVPGVPLQECQHGRKNPWLGAHRLNSHQNNRLCEWTPKPGAATSWLSCHEWP